MSTIRHEDGSVTFSKAAMDWLRYVMEESGAKFIGWGEIPGCGEQEQEEIRKALGL